MDWRDVLHVEIEGWGLSIHAGIVLGLFVAGIAVLLALAGASGPTWRVTKANFSFAGCGQVEICPSNDVAQIAHNAWVELKSRKAAIPFDPEHDVIAEIYNSYYELFRILRELAKTVPPRSVRAASDTPQIVDALMGALNDGLRPHLTRWQARFRRWYDLRLSDPETALMSPQEVQREFPEYDTLVADLFSVSVGLSQFADELRRIAHERRRKFSIRRSKAASQSLNDRA